jgi:hypothetical protein
VGDRNLLPIFQAPAGLSALAEPQAKRHCPLIPEPEQTYRAIIACLLTSLWTGRKPTKRTYGMICYYFLGVASEAELLAHLTKLKRQDEATSKRR